MRLFPRLLAAGLLLTGLTEIALAQEPAAQDAPAATNASANANEKLASVPFAGGTFTITEGNGDEPPERMALNYEGKEIAHDYFISFNRVTKIGDIDVALFNLENGGAGCRPRVLIFWKKEGSATLQSERSEEDDCGQLWMAVADDVIYFMPDVLPGGDSKSVVQWTPLGGLATAGRLSFAPDPNTGWDDIDLSGGWGIVHAFTNEAVYKTAEKMLGGRLFNVAESLLISEDVRKTRSGVFYGSGNKPHNSSLGRAFMAVDAKDRKLYFYLESDGSEPQAWPALKDWPKEIKDELDLPL
ncbi:hypothetical protein [Mesorhizobium retamae]|uniref:Uncharacterized protein n=1 Tax=Mesorhizobium retamae TaxID=2912854 RepID=A0ABS9QM08_9HYPH|nr:hypothetical protein [Mesorhizobium sp. IRAMC:0171]MCG7508475.1 hypothetical protein [Mesorhizobium sp. IRAMC:0171]